MKIKKIIAILLSSAVIASTFAGCGINKNATAIKYNEEEISLGLVNFMCRYQQAGSDEFMLQMGGDDVWLDENLTGTGVSMQESTKDSVIQGLHELYTVRDHMKDYNIELTDDEKSKITEVAKTFMEANSKDAIDEMGASQEIIEEMLTLYTIRSKMYTAIIADADTNVSDDEANMRGYSYVEIGITGSYDAEAGQYVEITDEEKNQLKDKAKLIAQQVSEGKTLEDAAKDNDCEAKTGTYAANDEALDADVKAKLDSMKVGETSDSIETENACFVVRLDSESDEMATEENKKQIIKDRQKEFYEDTLKKWQENDTWNVKDKQIEKIKFDDHFKHEKSTEASDEATTEAPTEAVSESTEK